MSKNLNLLYLALQVKTRHTRTLTLKVFNEEIIQVQEVKYTWGIYWQKSLFFVSGFKNNAKNGHCNKKPLRRSQRYTAKTTVNLLKTLVISHVDYDVLLLTGLNNNTLLSLDKQIKWGLRAACKKPQLSSSIELKLSCNVLGIFEHMEFRKLIYFYKLTHDKLAAFSTLSFPNYPNKWNARTHKCILNKKAKTNYSGNSYIFSAIRSWNELPHELRIIQDLRTFKSRLKQHLVTKMTESARILSSVTWRDFDIR